MNARGDGVRPRNHSPKGELMTPLFAWVRAGDFRLGTSSPFRRRRIASSSTELLVFSAQTFPLLPAPKGVAYRRSHFCGKGPARPSILGIASAVEAVPKAAGVHIGVICTCQKFIILTREVTAYDTPSQTFCVTVS